MMPTLYLFMENLAPIASRSLSRLKEKAFVEQGGFTERFYRVRSQSRNRGRRNTKSREILDRIKRIRRAQISFWKGQFFLSEGRAGANARCGGNRALQVLGRGGLVASAFNQDCHAPHITSSTSRSKADLRPDQAWTRLPRESC